MIYHLAAIVCGVAFVYFVEQITEWWISKEQADVNVVEANRIINHKNKVNEH